MLTFEFIKYIDAQSASLSSLLAADLASQRQRRMQQVTLSGRQQWTRYKKSPIHDYMVEFRSVSPSSELIRPSYDVIESAWWRDLAI